MGDRMSCAFYYSPIKLTIAHKNYEMINLLIKSAKKHGDHESDPLPYRNCDPLASAIRESEKCGDIEMKNYLLCKNCRFKQKKIPDGVRQKRNNMVNFNLLRASFTLMGDVIRPLIMQFIWVIWNY